MSTDKLSELSKPVAYKFDHGVMGPGDFKYGTPQMHSTAKDENASPLYSQEYVSALLAERDAFEASALAMRDEWRARGERIAELEAKLDESRETTLLVRDEWQKDKARADAAEKRLATPVRLQSPWVDKVGNRWLLEGTTADVIRAAGFAVTVEGDSE